MAYHHLSINERDIIATQLSSGNSYRAIATMLQRSHTSISREINRNRHHYTCDYSSKNAQQLTDYWCLSPTHAKRREHKPLYDHVIKKLHQGHSPDIIAGCLKALHPDDLSMRVSHETIYRWIYDNRRNGGDLYKSLLRRHPCRKKHTPDRRGGSLKGRVSIKDRPASVELREDLNHWEGDLVEGKRGTGYFVTITERKSRLTLASKVDKKEASIVASAIIKLLKAKKDNVQSITFDNGREFYDFEKVKKALDADIFFADPYSSWQRGSNEHANGMLRRYYKKGISFKDITSKQVQSTANIINNRPRKILGYKTAIEVFQSG